MSNLPTAAELEAAVREDIRCHRENGASLNPYSTQSSRWSWQNGFDGKPEAFMDYKVPYLRGQCAARLLKEAA